MKSVSDRLSKQFGVNVAGAHVASVALVALAVAIGALFIFSLRPRYSISNTETASWAYRRGLMATEGEFVRYADKLNSICDDVDRADVWFCYEGIGVASMKRFGDLNGTGLLNWRAKFPNPNSLNFLGVGIALSSIDIFNTEIWSIAKSKYSEAERAAIVDGWGFGQTVFVRTDEVEATRRCQVLNEGAERESCLFGVGRSLLFSQRAISLGWAGPSVGLSERERRVVLLGLGFALGFAGRLTSFASPSLPDVFTVEQGRVVQSGIRFGELARRVLEKREHDIRDDESPIVECLRKSRVASVCLGLY